MSNRDNISSFIKGAIFGGIIGAGIALLFAPKTGKEFRDDIKKKSADIKDKTDKKFADAKGAAAHILEQGMKKAEELSRQAEHLIRDAQERADEILKDIKKHDTTVHAEKSDGSADAYEDMTTASEPTKDTDSKTKKTKKQSS